MRKVDSVKNEPPDIYERDQNLNFITKFLHNNRNKNLISFMDEIVSQSNNKTNNSNLLSKISLFCFRRMSNFLNPFKTF